VTQFGSNIRCYVATCHVLCYVFYYDNKPVETKPSTDLHIIAECKALGQINYLMSELILR